MNAYWERLRTWVSGWRRLKLLIVDFPERGGAAVMLRNYKPGKEFMLNLKSGPVKAHHNDGYVLQMIVNGMLGMCQFFAQTHLDCRDEGCHMVEMANDMSDALQDVAKKYENLPTGSSESQVAVSEGSPGGGGLSGVQPMPERET